MEKVISLVMSSVLAISLLSGCGSTSKTSNATNTGAASSSSGSSAAAGSSGAALGGEVKGDAVKIGLAVISSIAKSKDAGKGDGLGQVDSTVV